MIKKRRTLAIVLGMPKSGKGTWVDKVKARYPKIPVIGVGDVCRAEEGANSDLFISARNHMTEKGTTLWPTTELFLAFGRRFSEGCADADFIIVDGLLRKPDQVARIISLAQDYGFDRILIIHVDTPAEECLSRPDRGGRSDEGAILRRIGDFEKETMPAKRKMLEEHPDFVESITLDGSDMFKYGDRYVEAICALYASDLTLAK